MDTLFVRVEYLVATWWWMIHQKSVGLNFVLPCVTGKRDLDWSILLGSELLHTRRYKWTQELLIKMRFGSIRLTFFFTCVIVCRLGVILGFIYETVWFIFVGCGQCVSENRQDDLSFVYIFSARKMCIVLVGSTWIVW